MKKVYVDTNVFVDYHNNSHDSLRPLGLFAFACFSRGWNCSFSLVVSSWVRKEVLRHLSLEEYEEVLREFRSVGKLREVTYSDAEFTKSRAYEHANDALHALIALREGCDAIVTRNREDFACFADRIDILYPESV